MTSLGTVRREMEVMVEMCAGLLVLNEDEEVKEGKQKGRFATAGAT